MVTSEVYKFARNLGDTLKFQEPGALTWKYSTQRTHKCLTPTSKI